MSDDIAIKVQNITKKYRLYESPQHRLREALHPFRKKYHTDFLALDDISFEVKKGETFGILGRNGSGKSTLLQIICGVLQPSAGFVSTNGRISALLELGAGFNPEFTGRDNLYMNGALMGFTREEMEARFPVIADFADIGDFIDQPVKTYSSGMYIRLAFAAAVHVDPEILIVDEALAVGDMMFQAKCMDKIKSMMQKGITTLFVTHDMNTVNTLCSNALMLEDGQIFTQGKPQVVTLQYYQLMREKEHVKQAAQRMVRTEDNVKQDSPLEEAKGKIKEKTSEEDYRYGIGTAKIVNYGIFNSANEETASIRCGEHFKVRLQVEFLDRVENPCFGFTLSNMAGQSLLAVHSFIDCDERFGPRQGGEILDMELSTVMLLNPGKYLLSIGVADHRTMHDFTNIDARKNICSVEVYGKEYSSGMIHHTPSVRTIVSRTMNDND